MLAIESAGLTDIGNKRKNNEDSYFLDDDLKLYIVADGMGGHLAGEVASKLVVDTTRDYLKRFHTGIQVEELIDTDPSLSKNANRLIAGLQLANSVVNKFSENKGAYSGMGSTVSAVYFPGDSLIASNIGDSPIFLVHKGEISLVSVIHNVAAEQAILDPEGAKDLNGKYSNILTRAMGKDEDIMPATREIRVVPGDIIILCSDGLSSYVPDHEIKDIVAAGSLEESCKTLVDLALERGGHDNITVVLLRVKKVRGFLSGLFEFLKKPFG
ncbi:MAG: protein phosphatase 2C domain-containing protein [Proteobacteria bacterium]|nr:protein phosphatase 2C domain-containing protein [Pseudomonadota bacterium]MBU1708397.1 protein phosphatase 2C domain-containing protein [Pseudomonadota bacterium]